MKMENITTKVNELNALLQELKSNNFSEDNPETVVLSEMMVILHQAYEIVADKRDEIINTKI